MGAIGKYKKEYVEQITRLADEGLCLDEIAGRWDITYKTLYEWSKKHAEFSEPYKVAKQKYQAWIFDHVRRGLSKAVYPTKNAELLLRFAGKVEHVEGFTGTIEQSLKQLLASDDYTADQKVKLAQCIDTCVRASETSQYIERMERIENHLGLKDKTRVGKS